MFGQLVSVIVKTLRTTNLVASSCSKMKKTSLPVDVRRSKTPFLKLLSSLFSLGFTYFCAAAYASFNDFLCHQIYTISGAIAAAELKLFDLAISWCDSGLLVYFCSLHACS